MNEPELLFTEILNCNRSSLFLNKESPLDKDKSILIASVLKRRIKGEPIQYILGKTEFMGLEFKVNKDVFIPRPETEILVEKTLKVVRELNILDMGTGSGCIAISLATLLPNAKIDAIDISEKALKIAKENAKLNNVNINFIQGDLFTPHPSPLTPYDLIVSNPPYVPTAEIEGLQLEIKYEPDIALDGGKDGLDFYRRVVTCAPNYLNKGGFLIMEMGFNQRPAVENIFQKSGNFEIIEVVRDYNNIERVVVTRKIREDISYGAIY